MSDTSKNTRYRDLVEAAACRVTGPIDTATIGYITEGGTYILASSSRWNDEGRPHDLVGVLPVALEGSRVVILRPTVHPDLVAALRNELDGEQA